jgi:hypothetical protein
MANTKFYVPVLKKLGVWVDYRAKFPGGFGWNWYAGAANRPLSQVKYIIAHHTVTKPSGNAKKDVTTISSIHKVRGFGGIGYHFIITSEEKNGYAIVAYVGDIGSARAHFQNRKGALGIRANCGNLYTLGISFIGDFRNQKPTAAQLRSYHELVKELIYGEDARLPKLKDYSCVHPHWDGDPTACPVRWRDIKSAHKNPPPLKEVPIKQVSETNIIAPPMEDKDKVTTSLRQSSDLVESTVVVNEVTQAVTQVLDHVTPEQLLTQIEGVASQDDVLYEALLSGDTRSLKDDLLTRLSSRKLWLVILGTVLLLSKDYFSISQETANQVLVLFSTFIGVEGLADYQKVRNNGK